MVDTVIQLAAEKLESKEATRTVIDHLMPRTVYSFNVSAYFLDSEVWGRPRRIDVETLSDGTPICLSTRDWKEPDCLTPSACLLNSSVFCWR